MRVNGDLALFQAIGALLAEWDAIDRDLVATHARGFETWRAHVADLDRDQVEQATGLKAEQVYAVAELIRDSSQIVTSIAEATLGSAVGVDWKGLRDGYSTNSAPHLACRARLRGLPRKVAPP